LGSVEADPDAIDLGARVPEGDVFVQVAGAREHLARDGPVNIDLAAFNVRKDALVGGRFAANVVILWEAVNGDGDAEARNLHPFERNGNDGAGDDEAEDVESAKSGKNAGEFAMADEGFAADQGDVDGLVFADEVEDAVDQGIATEVVELAESDIATEMRVAIGVTARAGKRALAGDFNGEHGEAADEDASPSREDFAICEAGIGRERRRGVRHIGV
jgi:hypothetical protein